MWALRKTKERGRELAELSAGNLGSETDERDLDLPEIPTGSLSLLLVSSTPSPQGSFAPPEKEISRGAPFRGCSQACSLVLSPRESRFILRSGYCARALAVPSSSSSFVREILRDLSSCRFRPSVPLVFSSFFFPVVRAAA